VPRSSRCLPTIQTRLHGTERTLGFRETPTGQGHGICADRIPGSQDAVCSSLAVKRPRLLAKFCDQARRQRRRSPLRSAEGRNVQRARLGFQNWTPLFDEFSERLQSGRVLPIVHPGSVASSLAINTQKLPRGLGVVRVQLRAPWGAFPITRVASDIVFVADSSGHSSD
jgi:hypothetical protein